jgi:outer membrane protein TolC
LIINNRIAIAERTYALKGLSKIGEVQDAKLALVQAKNSCLQALYDLAMAQVDLEKAIGIE